MDKNKEYNLDRIRTNIDKTDAKLVKLLEERMKLVEDVASYKKINNLEILNSGREEEVIEKINEAIVNKDYLESIDDIFISVMNASKSYQQKLINEKSGSLSKNTSNNCLDFSEYSKLGYYGAKGSFTYEALVKFFGVDNDENTVSYKTFEEVFKAVDKGIIDYGVVPIENSSTGGIKYVYDLLNKYDVHIKAEEYVKIDQNLMGIKGAKLEDIKEVYSHIQGIEQSSDFLEEHKDWKVIPTESTSTCAKMVRDEKNKSNAAIAGKMAAREYNLEIIREKINNETENYTRFIIIGKNNDYVSDADVVSVVLSMNDEAGYLYNILGHFYSYNINMVKIESRPIKNLLWEYFLYIDFEGNLADKKVNTLIDELRSSASHFKVLGNYKKNIGE